MLGVIIKSFFSVISSLLSFKKAKRKEKQTAVSIVRIVLDSIVPYNSLGGMVVFVLSCTNSCCCCCCLFLFFFLAWLATRLHYRHTHTDVSYYLVDAVITPTWKPFLSLLKSYSNSSSKTNVMVS